MNIEINVPDGISGEWKVESFTVSKDESKMMRVRSIFTGVRGSLPAGNYKKLTRNGTMVMSNTPDEIRDFSSFAYRAKGHILINGLGIGVLVKALLGKEDVLSIEIIEKSKDVIKLSGPTYSQDKRVTIINADAFDYKSPLGVRYNYVWHDIWDDITSDNLPEMHKLHRKYGRKSDNQESWCRYQCEQQKRQARYY
jgi:hypothetical protein